MSVRLVTVAPSPLRPAAEVALLLRERLGVEAAVILDEAVFFVPPDEVAATARRLRDDPALAFDYLRCLSAVDYIDYLEVVYHLLSLRERQKAVMKARLVEPDLTVDSVVGIWRGADWHEREAADLFGITFRGHPNLRRLLLPDEFEGFPLRKSYPLAPLPSEEVEEGEE
ncbi:MAG: NADH-quinone oxidoreductase subunit C [Chloroflexota bacterium]|nr:NADH-quinone oxidoreductase subunit C [Dehalococcoidia bacterium]MDW8254861.1 NADH-quinone oxidoreductase subunit C [Chloroflexota bacterium]